MVAPSNGGLFYLTTSLKADEYAAFADIVNRNNVSISAYLRAMIIDVIVEETSRDTKVQAK